VLSRSLYEILPSVSDRWQRLHAQAPAGESASRREDFLIWPDGRRQWVAWDASPWRTCGETIGGVLIAVQDITGRRAIEEALATNQARLEAALASMTEAVAIYGADGRLAQFNGGFVSFHKFADKSEYEKTVSSDPTFLQYYDESGQIRPLSEQPDRLAINGETGIGLVYCLRRKDTTAQWFGSYNFGPIRGRGGEIVGAVVTAQDVTAEKRAEEARRKADRRKDEFLAVLAHELRNPLAPIHNAVQALRKAQDASVEKRGALYDMMERQVRHLVRLVDDLIEISRIVRDKIELRRERCDLAEILRNAVETAQPLIEQNHHSVGLHPPAEEVTLVGDPVRLVQVFANLINNAAKYTPPGGAIDIAAERQGDMVRVAVRNNGIGIPPESLPHVFELFMQGDSGRRAGGLGVGLALTCKLVQLHGGTIEARSQGRGEGSEFVVSLPLEASAPETVSLAKAQEDHSHRPIRALIIDDDPDVADSLGLLLSTLGAEIRVVYDGLSGIDAISDFMPEVVFVDLGMPGMDGCETARRIRSTQIGRTLRLVALTGWGQDEARVRTREAGFDAHLIKPASLEALEQALQGDAKA
jgi:signal transduction histidine kinase/CheY-like chemotaxis protein